MPWGARSQGRTTVSERCEYPLLTTRVVTSWSTADMGNLDELLARLRDDAAFAAAFARDPASVVELVDLTSEELGQLARDLHQEAATPTFREWFAPQED